jgi:hypothetical protein
MEAVTMATLVKQIEGAPDGIPDALYTVALSTAAKALDRAAIWTRLEQYVAVRWTPRSVEFIAEGPGEWHPPLTPVEIETVELWSDGDWVETFDLSASPYGGFFLPGCGPYRFTGEAGGGSLPPDIPEIVLEAYRRLTEYLADTGKPGVTRESKSIGNALDVSYSRAANWQAMAFQNSGAADLLRSFRRA